MKFIYNFLYKKLTVVRHRIMKELIDENYFLYIDDKHMDKKGNSKLPYLKNNYCQYNALVHYNNTGDYIIPVIVIDEDKHYYIHFCNITKDNKVIDPTYGIIANYNMKYFAIIKLFPSDSDEGLTIFNDINVINKYTENPDKYLGLFKHRVEHLFIERFSFIEGLIYRILRRKTNYPLF